MHSLQLHFLAGHGSEAALGPPGFTAFHGYFHIMWQQNWKVQMNMAEQLGN